MKIFTLRKPFDESNQRSILNGKVFAVKRNRTENTLAFIDASSKYNDPATIWLSTPLVSKEETDDGIILTTESGAVFDLVDVLTLIPTKSVSIKSSAENAVAPKTISRVIIDQPEGFGGMYSVDVEYNDGSMQRLFSYFPDEYDFDTQQFAGKTYEEAMQIYYEADKAYLQS